jgi:polyisoprenoid-binding protein YceI
MLWSLTGLAGAPAAALPLTYGITPNSTDISFVVDILGVATAEGAFKRFSGSLVLDIDHPELSTVSVRIDSKSAAMGWEPAQSMVTGESYLDGEHFPEIQFSSRTVTLTGKDKVRLEGVLTLRGVSHWESFDAELLDRQQDGERGADLADFAAVGTVHRSDYLMVADRAILDDRVTFTIRTRLLLNGPLFSPVPVP